MSKEQEEQQPNIESGRECFYDNGGFLMHLTHIHYSIEGERVLTLDELRGIDGES